MDIAAGEHGYLRPDFAALAGGALRPDPSRPGRELAVWWADLEDYRVYGRRAE